MRGMADEFKRNLDEWTNLNFRAIKIFEERDAQNGQASRGVRGALARA